MSFRLPAEVTGNSAPQIQNIEGGAKIELKDVWFKYPTRDVPIFTGLNITVSRICSIVDEEDADHRRSRKDNLLRWLGLQAVEKHQLVISHLSINIQINIQFTKLDTSQSP